MWELLYENKFQETAALVTGTLFVMTIILFALSKKSSLFMSGFATARSWFFIAPLIFLFCGLSWPYPLIVLCIVSIYGAKNFFQMTGMYHRSNFVYACYLAIIATTLCIQNNLHGLYNQMPIIMLGTSCFIPLLRNSYKHMVQYIALSLLNFCFIWAFLHLGLIMKMESGVYTFIYIILVTEFFDTIYLAISRHLKNVKLISNITPKRSLEGFVLAGVLTLILGWGMRHLLPIRTEWYWGAVSLTCIFIW